MKKFLICMVLSLAVFYASAQADGYFKDGRLIDTMYVNALDGLRVRNVPELSGKNLCTLVNAQPVKVVAVGKWPSLVFFLKFDKFFDKPIDSIRINQYYIFRYGVLPKWLRGWSAKPLSDGPIPSDALEYIRLFVSIKRSDFSLLNFGVDFEKVFHHPSFPFDFSDFKSFFGFRSDVGRKRHTHGFHGLVRHNLSRQVR